LLAAAKRCSGLFITCSTACWTDCMGPECGSCGVLVRSSWVAAVAAAEIACGRPAGI
jgi:hypothetical protein